ncbi:fatty acyl-AMP ligase [Streptomyces sp. NPDC048362]|uniref:fatty acyl-AMP ligase n=1 Tax=Streptomyces sp. NPDC048362 TaxID=3365539 RepID=UPI00371B71DB
MSTRSTTCEATEDSHAAPCVRPSEDQYALEEGQNGVPVSRHPGGSTLAGLLRWAARRYPERTACITLHADGAEKESLTYGELDVRARAVATALYDRIGPGARALLVLPPGLDFLTAFFACSYAGVIAVPVPDPNGAFSLQRLTDRLRGIVGDCTPDVVLTTPDLASRGSAALTGDFDIPRLAPQDVDVALAADWEDPGTTSDSVALLQYTSGSTSAPKGVVLTHGNVTENLAAIAGGIGQVAGESADFTGVTWLPPFHDMGLATLLLPCFLGGRAVVLTPMTFLMNPSIWLQSIDRYGAQFSAAPNFAYDLCIERITPEHRKSIDLHGWKYALSGAEPVRAATLDRFAAAYSGSGFRSSAFMPSYGLAEANVYVSGGRRPDDARVIHAQISVLERERRICSAEDNQLSRPLVGVGRLPANLRARIVDPESQRPCAAGHVGEIWLAGANVAQGYWGNPDATDASFGGRLADSNEGPYLRTHDLGFLRDGQLFVIGRTDDLIIIDGRNVHPQDVELSVEESHAAVARNRVAVFGWGDKAETQVCVVAETTRPYRIVADADARSGSEHVSRTEIARAVRSAVFDSHQIGVAEVVFLKPGSLPRTTSGKIQRQQTKRLLREGELHAW